MDIAHCRDGEEHDDELFDAEYWVANESIDKAH